MAGGADEEHRGGGDPEGTGGATGRAATPGGWSRSWMTAPDDSPPPAPPSAADVDGSPTAGDELPRVPRTFRRIADPLAPGSAEATAATDRSPTSPAQLSDPRPAESATPPTPARPPPGAATSPSGVQGSQAPAPPPSNARARSGRSLTNLWITLGLLAVGGLAAWWFLRPQPVALVIDDVPVTNGEAVLAQAERALEEVVAADQSSTAEGMGCWFGPNPDRGGELRVVCGPVLVGTAAPDQQWLAGEVSWSVGSDQATGEFQGLDGPTTAQAAQLQRPDGTSSAEVDLEPPTAGLRTETGATVTNAGDALAAVEGLLATAIDDTGAASNDTTGCWYEVVEAPSGRTTTNGDVWCGPVLTVDSDPAAPWIETDVFLQDGDVLSTARADPRDDVDLRTGELDPAVTLGRPDGTPRPDTVDLDLPDAAPVEAGYVAILEQPLADVATTPPDDGLLRTPSMQWRITGLATVPQVGSGPDAIVAPEGHEVVVAVSEFAPGTDDGFIDAGEATLVVDGTRRPLEEWSFINEDTTGLVAVVPDDVATVTVEVLADGRSQAISLLDGALQPGAPAGMYRPQEPVGIGRSVQVRVALPESDPATAEMTVTAAHLRGWLPDDGYAPDGQVFMVADLARVDVTQPCCELDDLEVTATPLLVLDGQAAQPLVHDSSSAVWIMPVDTTSVGFDLRVVATWAGGNQARGRADQPATAELPR